MVRCKSCGPGDSFKRWRFEATCELPSQRAGHMHVVRSTNAPARFPARLPSQGQRLPGSGVRLLFTPVLLEDFKKVSGTDSFENVPFLSEKVEWETVGGTYVPTTFSIQYTFVPNKLREVRLALNWSYVNEDVPDSFLQNPALRSRLSKH